MSLFGREIVVAVAGFVIGLILIKWINEGLKKLFSKWNINPVRGATIRNILCVLMFGAMVTFAATELGVAVRPVVRFQRQVDGEVVTDYYPDKDDGPGCPKSLSGEWHGGWPNPGNPIRRKSIPAI